MISDTSRTRMRDVTEWKKAIAEDEEKSHRVRSQKLREDAWLERHADRHDESEKQNNEKD